MTTRAQARVWDSAQAERVRLAILWSVRPEDICMQRVYQRIGERLLAQQGEKVLQWQK